MARTTHIISAPRLNDLVLPAGTTQGLTSLVNAYLASLVNPFIVEWSLNVRFLNKRMDPQWMFTVTTLDDGPTLAAPFTLSVLQNTSAANLATAVNALYAAALPAQFISEPSYTKLDSDEQGQALQYVAAHLRNANAAAKINYGYSAQSESLASGLVAAVQNANRFAVNAQGGTGQATEANAEVIVPFAGVLRNLRAFPSAAIGGGATVTVAMRINGVTTALLVSFVNADGTTPKVDADYVAVAAGDRVDFLVSCDNAGAPAANLQASVEYIH